MQRAQMPGALFRPQAGGWTRWAAAVGSRCAGGFLALLLLGGCDGAPPEKPAAADSQRVRIESLPSTHPTPWFDDITARGGLAFHHRTATNRPYFMPRSVGSGACAFDFDNDGRLDVYLIQNAGPESGVRNQLFRQEAGGRFQDVSDGSGLDVAGWGMGVAAGDADNDGLPDVVVTEYGSIRLFQNLGAGRFLDVTGPSGLHRVLWGTSACWLDFDRDGWLDLAVANYLEYDPARPCADPSGARDFCGPVGFPGSVTKLYRNLGSTPGGAMRFEDVTGTSGLGSASGPGLGVVSEDFNEDGWPDLLVSNDGRPNHLWINLGDGRFREDGMLHGIAVNGLGHALANMGIAIGDVRGTGELSVFMTHLTEETPGLWTRTGPGMLFEDTTSRMGLTRLAWQGTGFGTVLADFDLDGDLDLVIANGRVRRDMTRGQGSWVANADANFWDPYRERNQVLEMTQSAGFADRSQTEPAFCAEAGVHRSLVLADFDNDGAQDLLVTQIDGAARLLRNVAAHRGHWLTVRAIDPRWKRDAYGAVVTIRAGSLRLRRFASPAYSYLASNDSRVNFGLGSVAVIDEVQVRWPDGLRERFPHPAVDQILTMRRGEGRPLADPDGK